MSNLETKNYSRRLYILDLLSSAKMPDVIGTEKISDKKEEVSILRRCVDFTELKFSHIWTRNRESNWRW